MKGREKEREGGGRDREQAGEERQREEKVFPRSHARSRLFVVGVEYVTRLKNS